MYSSARSVWLPATAVFRSSRSVWGGRLAATSLALAASAFAQVDPQTEAPLYNGEPQFRASLLTELTVTDNARLEESNKDADLILRLTPTIAAAGEGARLSWSVNYSPSLLFYLDNTDLSDVQNNLNARGLFEAVDNFFFVEGFATVQQAFVNPFLPTPADSTVATGNRVEMATFGISPFIQGELFGDYRYLVRNDNRYTNASSGGFGDTLTSRFLATIDSPVNRRLFWGADANYDYIKYEDTNAFHAQLVRGRAGVVVTDELSIRASGGYEWNDYGVTDYSGAIYGVGFDWRPTPRTRLDANWEDRFFGSSYNVSFNHRTRLTSWSLVGYRNIETADDLLFRLTPGFTRSNLDAILSGKIVDPLAREVAIDKFMTQSGLPEVIGSQLSYYNQNIFLVERIEASTGILGVRNSLNFRLYWEESEAITGQGDPASELFARNSNFRSRGGGVAFTHDLSGRSTLTLSADRNYTESLTTQFGINVGDDTIQDTLRMSVTHQATPDTSLTARVRFIRFNADIGNDYREHAVQALILHYF
jgi:uncharacterized protein (PEP-CTERM system associated)